MKHNHKSQNTTTLTSQTHHWLTDCFVICCWVFCFTLFSYLPFPAIFPYLQLCYIFAVVFYDLCVFFKLAVVFCDLHIKDTICFLSHDIKVACQSFQAVRKQFTVEHFLPMVHFKVAPHSWAVLCHLVAFSCQYMLPLKQCWLWWKAYLSLSISACQSLSVISICTEWAEVIRRDTGFSL